jgi:hypothetical protein
MYCGSHCTQGGAHNQSYHGSQRAARDMSRAVTANPSVYHTSVALQAMTSRVARSSGSEFVGYVYLVHCRRDETGVPVQSDIVRLTANSRPTRSSRCFCNKRPGILIELPRLACPWDLVLLKHWGPEVSLYAEGLFKHRDGGDAGSYRLPTHLCSASLLLWYQHGQDIEFRISAF